MQVYTFFSCCDLDFFAVPGQNEFSFCSLIAELKSKLPVSNLILTLIQNLGLKKKKINAQSHRAEILILISPPFYNFNIIVAIPSQS